MTDKHRMKPKFRKNCARLERGFPAAHKFLTQIENDGAQHELWLSTAVNAHLYKANAYLAYLRIQGDDVKPPAIVLSPKFNNRIAEHTSDRSAALFPANLEQLVDHHGGLTQGWARWRPNGALELQRTTPSSFFDQLFNCVADLDVS